MCVLTYVAMLYLYVYTPVYVQHMYVCIYVYVRTYVYCVYTHVIQQKVWCAKSSENYMNYVY